MITNLDNKQDFVEARAEVENLKVSSQLENLAINAGKMIVNNNSIVDVASQKSRVSITSVSSAMFASGNTNAANKTNEALGNEQREDVNSAPAPTVGGSN